MGTYPTLSAGQKFSAALATSMLPLTVFKTADESVNNTTTLQNDNELFLPVAAPAKYFLDMLISVSSNTTPDIKFGFTAPTDTTMTWSLRGITTAMVAVGGDINTDIRQVGSTTAMGGVGVGVNTSARLVGFVNVPSTTGTLQLQWAQNALEVSNTTVLADSWMKLTRVA